LIPLARRSSLPENQQLLTSNEEKENIPMLNKVQLIGHVGHDVEIRETPQGTKVADLRLATTRYWRDAEGNRQEETEWHRVVFWGKSAENVASVLEKGRLVYIEGRIQTRSWEDDSGKHYRTEVVAESWQALSRAAGSEDVAA
jgi:single-strand DNA-binding protein